MKKLLYIFLFLPVFAPAQVQMFFTSDSSAFITSPLDVDSLFYWFDASQGVFDSIGSPISNFQGVQTWNDISGNGHHVGLGNFSGSAIRPVWNASAGPNSRPAIIFSSSTGLDQLEEIDSTFWESDDFTAFAVWKVANATSNEANFPVMSFGKTGSDNQIWGVYGDNTAGTYRYTLYASANGTANVLDTWTLTKSTTFRIDSWVINTAANQSALYSNGAVQTRAINGTQSSIYNTFSELWIGRRSQTISEIIVYSRALTTAELEAIESYLNHKYKIY